MQRGEKKTHSVEEGQQGVVAKQSENSIIPISCYNVAILDLETPTIVYSTVIISVSYPGIPSTFPVYVFV